MILILKVSAMPSRPLSSGYPSSRNGRRKKGGSAEIWNVVNRILTLLVIAGFLVMLALWFYPEVQKRNALATDLELKTSELAEEQLLRKKREREKFLLENDPDYIEAIARDRLDLMKEGETIFRLDGNTAEEVPPAVVPKN